MKRRIDSKHEIAIVEETKVQDINSTKPSQERPVQSISIRNIYNGNEIPEDEPTFIFRAKDRLSVKTLLAYYRFCTMDNCTVEQLESLENMINEFKTWQKNNPDKMKQPGSTMPEDMKKLRTGHIPTEKVVDKTRTWKG